MGTGVVGGASVSSTAAAPAWAMAQPAMRLAVWRASRGQQTARSMPACAEEPWGRRARWQLFGYRVASVLVLESLDELSDIAESFRAMVNLYHAKIVVPTSTKYAQFLLVDE